MPTGPARHDEERRGESRYGPAPEGPLVGEGWNPFPVRAVIDAVGAGRNLSMLWDSWGRGWSAGAVIAADPAEIVESGPGAANPFARIERAVAALPEHLWLGYFGYDLGRSVEEIPECAEDDLGLPVMRFCAYPAWVSLQDGHIESRGDRGLALELEKEVEDAMSGARGAGSSFAVNGTKGDIGSGVLRSFTREAYEDAVAAALEHIRAGDFYQVNLSQRFSAPVLDASAPAGASASAGAIGDACPAPFSAYVDAGEFTIMSASPELFLSARGGVLTTRPIKGTRPRSRDPQQDARLARELMASPKDRAENLMIVDLVRNDLGRVCRPGTVDVPRLWGGESFAAVHHLVSTVTGEVTPNAGLEDVMRAVFPGGSITGAPKVVAMRFIEESEPVRRGVYTGAIGRIGPMPPGAARRPPPGERPKILAGSLDFELNIAIRTVVATKGWAHLSVGGGIVADSVPGLEYQETLDKAVGLASAIGLNL